MTCVLASEMPASRPSCGVSCPRSDIAARKETMHSPEMILTNRTPHPQVAFGKLCSEQVAVAMRTPTERYPQLQFDGLGQRYAGRRHNPGHAQNFLILDVSN